MKTNLKTCPDSPWKTAFEKELRLKLLSSGKSSNTIIQVWRSGRKDLILDILGVSEGEATDLLSKSVHGKTEE